MRAEERISRHLLLAVITTVFSVMLSMVTVVMAWEFWTIPLMVAGCLSVWLLHIAKTGSDTFFEYLCSGLILLEFFYFGVHEDSLYNVPAMACIIILALFMLNKKCILYVLGALYILELLYHILILHTISSSTEFRDIIRLGLGAIVVFGGEALAGFWINQRSIQRKWYDHVFSELEMVGKQNAVFLSNVSHELRTPITVLRGYTETLADGILEEQVQIDELYQRMLQECHGMERLVEDLFILSKMQNPDFKIDMEPVSLQQIFGDIMRSGKMIGKEKGIHFRMDAPEEDPCLIMGDYGRLRQMFLVIVNNAVKFSKEQGNVEIKIEKEGSKYNVSIHDYGVGISKEQLPFIFEKFYTSKMRQNEKGTGLGLMIAKQIALRHGGDIRVDSEVQKGTTFYFAFEECTCVEDFC